MTDIGAVWKFIFGTHLTRTDNGDGTVTIDGPTDATISTTDVTTNNVTSSKHGWAPKSGADATTFLNGAATPAYAAVKDSDLSTSDITTNNATSSKHGFLKKLSNVATEFLDGTGAFDTVKDSDLSTSDITTNDVTTSKHGFAPKAPNDTTKFLRGDGTWNTPSTLPSGSAVVATDAIWDAKGDLAAGTGADAAVRVAVGANGTVPTADSAATPGISYQYPGLVRICDLTLGADQASFDTNTILGGNIPNVYKHLLLILSLRSDRNATGDPALLVVNNDTTGANYNTQRLLGSNATASADVSVGTRTGILLGSAVTTVAGSLADSFGAFRVDIPDYLSANKKCVLSNYTAFDTAVAAGAAVGSLGGIWLSTSAITRLRVAPQVGSNWKTGSRFTLYGVA